MGIHLFAFVWCRFAYIECSVVLVAVLLWCLEFFAFEIMSSYCPQGSVPLPSSRIAVRDFIGKNQEGLQTWIPFFQWNYGSSRGKEEFFHWEMGIWKIDVSSWSDRCVMLIAVKYSNSDRILSCFVSLFVEKCCLKLAQVLLCTKTSCGVINSETWYFFKNWSLSALSSFVAVVTFN